MKITANHITLGRIFLLPVPAAMLLFGSLAWQYVALVLFIIIAIGDIFDGMLARRQGPTQFGAMLDPLADKLFIACVIVPFAAQGRAPFWFPAALLAREFVVTGLRTQTALRRQNIKTSVLGKLKTSIQMAGFGLVFLNETLPPDLAPWGLGAIGVTSALVFAIMAVRRRGLPSVFVWVPCTLLSMAFVWHLLFPRVDATLTYLYVILVFTWGSGLDYLVGSARIILKDGVKSVDVARSLWTAAAVVVATVVAVRPAFAFLVVIALGAEFAVGGVDNLRALAGQTASALMYAVRAVVSTGLALGVHACVVLQADPRISWGLAIGFTAFAGLNALWDIRGAWPLISSKEAKAAYSSGPPPRTASEG